jgi:3-oxoacyl-(acyl-carrier-protein) synthase
MSAESGVGRCEMVLRGAGLVLPGPGATACADLETFWEVLREGTCCLSGVQVEGLPLRIAGVVGDLEGFEPPGFRRPSRAASLALAATRAALADAGLHAADLDGRTLLVCSSLQFAFSETARHAARAARGGPADLGMDYWMTGTPPTVVGTVAASLGIGCPTLSVAGSCNVALRALEVALALVRAGDADRVVLVGAESALDPVFVAATSHTSRQGYRASSLSDDPGAVRPHDEVQDGNATGEGALALIWERPGAGPGPLLRLHTRTSRSNGPSVAATGPADRVAADMTAVLRSAGRTPGDLAFTSSYADGNRFVEDHFRQAVDLLREATGYRGPLPLTNQEAAFGHVAGTGGLVKVLGAVLMLGHGTVAPVTNCRTPYRALDADPVVGGAVRAGHATGVADAALVVSAGAGGDATSILVEHVSGGSRG